MSGSQSTLRCAIYTRKSSEEGLDQAFNSLDAQREACVDYIKSQKHQGWTPLADTFDDGGFSGGSTNRPGLQRLLTAIVAGRIDTVVVYKVDRLSRSLADFARLMQTFDEHGVSFVSVTQQFNTTTSMGRLTLNMLLSFAQFEREVAGERIRDKLAATFKRGVFVTGQPPLGYRRPKDGETGFAERTLLIVPEEAATVRAIYDTYVATKSLLAVATHVNGAGHRTKQWTSSRGRSFGGNRFSTGLVHRILTNPLYIGMIAHTRTPPSASPGVHRPQRITDLHQGLHQSIISRELWDKVQKMMTIVNRREPGQWTHTHLLKGKFRTVDGSTMSPGSTQRADDGDGKKLASSLSPSVRAPIVRYYVSQRAIKQGYAACPIKSLNAAIVDDLVRALVADHLRATQSVELGTLTPSIRDHWLREMIRQVTVGLDRIIIELSNEQVASCAKTLGTNGATNVVEAVGNSRRQSLASTEGDDAKPTPQPLPTCPFKPSVTNDDGITTITLAIHMKRMDGRRVLVSPEGHDLLLTAASDAKACAHPHLVHALGQAFLWRAELLRTGDSMDVLAARRRVSASQVKKLLGLTNLSPRIIRAALTAGLPPRVSVNDLVEAGQHLEWPRQEARLGLVSQQREDRRRA